MKKLDSLKCSLTKHLVDTTVLVGPSTPIFAAYETLVAGMSDMVSLKSRLLVLGGAYLGVGSLISRGRDYSRSFFGVTKESSEGVQKLHDFFYFPSVNLPIATFMYRVVGGETDWKKIGLGLGFALAYDLCLGPLAGYLIDSGRDLAGIDECHRPLYAKSLGRFSSNVKKNIATSIVAASLATTVGIYTFSPKNNISKEKTNISQGLEQKVSN